MEILSIIAATLFILIAGPLAIVLSQLLKESNDDS